MIVEHDLLFHGEHLGKELYVHLVLFVNSIVGIHHAPTLPHFAPSSHFGGHSLGVVIVQAHGNDPGQIVVFRYNPYHAVDFEGFSNGAV